MYKMNCADLRLRDERSSALIVSDWIMHGEQEALCRAQEREIQTCRCFHSTHWTSETPMQNCGIPHTAASALCTLDTMSNKND